MQKNKPYYLKSFKSFSSRSCFYGFCKQAFVIKINYRDSFSPSLSFPCVSNLLFLLLAKIHFPFWLIFPCFSTSFPLFALNVTKINKKQRHLLLYGWTWAKSNCVQTLPREFFQLDCDNSNQCSVQRFNSLFELLLILSSLPSSLVKQTFNQCSIII